MNNGLQPVIVFQLCCKHCGEVRALLAEDAPAPQKTCPLCGRPCAAVIRLGRGKTVRDLPHFAVWEEAHDRSRRILKTWIYAGFFRLDL